MSYVKKDGQVRWQGRLVKNCDFPSFKVLTPTIGRDTQKVYVRGKPVNADAPTFEVLSESYAKDQSHVYFLMQTKMKVVKLADPHTFRAVGLSHGADKSQAWFRDRRLKLTKGAVSSDLRSLGHVYSTDGIHLFFTTQRISSPDHQDFRWTGAQLKWFGDSDVNVPVLALNSGNQVWVNHRDDGWIHLPKADFDTLKPLPVEGESPSTCHYLRDTRRVWYFGEQLEDIKADEVTAFGLNMVRAGNRLWVGALCLPDDADHATYVMTESVQTDDGMMSGDVIHFGSHISVFHSRQPRLDFNPNWDITTAFEDLTSKVFKPLLLRQIGILQRFSPIAYSAQAIGEALDSDSREERSKHQESAMADHFEVLVNTEGNLVATFSDGQKFQRPLAGWFSLGCDIWAHWQGHDPEYIPYISLGTMLPRGDSLHCYLARTAGHALWQFLAAAWRQGLEDPILPLAHLCFWEAQRYARYQSDDMSVLAGVPPELMRTFSYRPAHHSFTVTTNLGAAREIVRSVGLSDPDFRNRIDLCGVLVGTALETNKTGHFLKEILPEVMDRYETEPLQPVRERLAAILEASLVAGQVKCEVSQKFYHADMLQVIDFCIAKGIHTRFNLARRADALWALGRDDEARMQAKQLIDAVGEDWTMPGVYCHRVAYRGPELWLLRGRIDTAWRKSTPEEHHARFRQLVESRDALRDRYGDRWSGDDVAQIEQDLARYANAVSSA